MEPNVTECVPHIYMYTYHAAARRVVGLPERRQARDAAVTLPIRDARERCDDAALLGLDGRAGLKVSR